MGHDRDDKDRKKPAKARPFHSPFEGLKLPARAPPAPARAAPARPARPAPPPPVSPGGDDDEALFRAAIGEVAPVRKGPARAPPPAPPTAAELRIQSAEDEAFLSLCELVAGEGPFDLSDSDEWMEGAITGLDPKILRKLRGGSFAVQAHLDLHGLTRDEARVALGRFVPDARKAGHRCVLVIHGRGLHSKDQLPVLKELTQQLLSRGAIGKQVLAFATARPHDGGPGAVYVLLRR